MSDKPASRLSTRSFIDTNVLIYADSVDVPIKQARALLVLKQAVLGGNGVISTQVLSEFCNVSLKKLKLSHAHIRNRLRFYEQLEVINVTSSIIQLGLDFQQTKQLNFFDAVIVATAHTSGCKVLYTEDLNNGQFVDQMEIVNPF